MLTLARVLQSAVLVMWKSRLSRLVIFGMLGLGRGASAVDTIINNPIQAQSFEQLVETITAQLVPIVSIFAVLAIIFVGFKFVYAAARGNDQEIKKTREMLVWVLVGSAIVVGASVIAAAVVNFAKGI